MSLLVTLESLEDRVVKLAAKFDGLGLALGDENQTPYAHGERHVPPSHSYVVTGFTLGEKLDLLVFYRELQLVKPTDEQARLSSIESRVARMLLAETGAAQVVDLPAAILELEQQFAGLKLTWDGPPRWVDYQKNFLGVPVRVPSRGVNILTTVIYGHRNNDLAHCWVPLKLDKTPDTSKQPGQGTPQQRVDALEGSFTNLDIDLGFAENTAGWPKDRSGGGSEKTEIPANTFMTALHWGTRSAYKKLALAK